MILRVFVVLLAIVASPSVTGAQQPRVYVGGTVDLSTQTESDTNPLGGTTWGGRALVGVHVSPRVGVEFEPSFSGSYSWQYTYFPTPSLAANVVASRRNTFFPVQARIRFGALEPVIGMGYVRGRISRHATIGSSTYFDDSGFDNSLAVVAGLDAAVPLAAHLHFVPTLRVLMTFTGATPADTLESQTNTGPFVLRYGAGLRATF